MTSSAWVSGLLDMRIRPSKGVCSSVVIRIAVPMPTEHRKIMGNCRDIAWREQAEDYEDDNEPEHD
jgi:hypothetical protein